MPARLKAGRQVLALLIEVRILGGQPILFLGGLTCLAFCAKAQPSEPPTTFSIAAVGDIMMHRPQHPAGLDRATGQYNYRPFFDRVRGVFGESQVVIGNLETPLAAPRFPTSGFPRFNARVELAEGLARAGFTHIGLANNHALDRGVVGLDSTIKAVESAGMRRFGVRMREAETGFTLATVEGVRIVVLGFTYGTNGIPQPTDRPYMVNLLTEAVVRPQMEAARARGDLLVVCAHFGNEYQRLPSEYQRRWVRTFLELGADVVFGAHPHVLQPVEMFSVRQTDGSEKLVPVFYSLGNFTAVQPGELTSTGAIGVAHFELVEGRPKFQRIEAIPTYHGFGSWGGARQFRVLPIRPQDLADLSSGERNRLTAIGQRAQRHLNQWLTRKPTPIEQK